MNSTFDYTLYKDFIDKYLPHGFERINRLDSFMKAMEEQLHHHKQFFYIADLLKVKILFTSAGSKQVIGLTPEQVDTSTFFILAHPEDQERLNHAQAKLYSMGQELFIEQKGISIVSVQIRERKESGGYIDLLLQTYSFFSDIPYRTVFTLILATELPPLEFNQQGFYYYSGNNPAEFRYPDESLLQTDFHFSTREIEILELIAAGLGSEQIADKLFLSVNTVNTHRRNILNKTERISTAELAEELKEKGII